MITDCDTRSGGPATAVTCRIVRAARLRPPRQVRSPRHVPRSVGRRGRAAVRPEVRRCAQWVPSPCPDDLSGPCPYKLEPCAAQPPREEPGGAADVAPMGLIHGMLVRSWAAAVGSAYVLVVDEELIQAWEPANPSDPEEAWRRPRPERAGEPCEIPSRENCSSSFSQSAPPTRQDKPGASEVVALTRQQVRSQIPGRPRVKERRCLRTELVKQVAELCSLDCVKELGHIAGV